LPLKIDMHVHTYRSNDAHTRPKELAFHAEKQGLDGVAITDHNTVSGLREFMRISGLLIVPGVEVTTAQGHVLALNVDHAFRAFQSFAETVDQIHGAGGLAVVAHPTAFFKGIPEGNIGRVFDAMEVVNSSAVPFSFSVRKNRKIAAKLGLPQTGGSDAHCANEVGMGFTVVEAGLDVEEVVEAIKQGAVTPFGKGIPWRMRFRREFLSLRKKLGDGS
jgi:predicted metal-dependent phosphoesterase TrpH